eukprot:gene14437-biopygen12634
MPAASCPRHHARGIMPAASCPQQNRIPAVRLRTKWSLEQQGLPLVEHDQLLLWEEGDGLGGARASRVCAPVAAGAGVGGAVKNNRVSRWLSGR